MLEAAPVGATAIAIYLAALVAVGALTRFRPAFGVAAFVALVPFAFYRTLGHTTITLSKAALLGLLAGLVLRRADPRVLRAPAAAALLWCAAAVVAATALSVAQAAFREPALRETLKSLEYLTIFAAVVVAARADDDDAPLRAAFAGATIAVSALALAQEFTGAPSAMYFMHTIVPRIAGPLEGPNQLSGYLGIALCVIAAFVLCARSTLWERLALGVGSTALILTLSRAGVAAALLGFGLIIVRSAQPMRRKAVAATIGAGALSAVAILAVWGYAHTLGASGAGLLARFFTLNNDPDVGSVGTRTQLWSAAFALWRQHPLFGIGAGNFEFELRNAGFPGIRTHANSLYLQALSEGGIPLLGATLALAYASIARFARGPFREPLVLAAFGAALAFAVHQVFDFLVFFPKVGELWWTVLALGAARADRAIRE